MRFRQHRGVRAVLFVALLLCPLIFSRGAESSRFRSRCRWKYIVIHHSATRKGNAAIMDRYHRRTRHMENGLAYHFVIDNGTSGAGDGEVEEGHRWAAQLAGGHVHQPWLNESGIGICLVGNFNRQQVAKEQMDSLVKLVNQLRDTYDIPLANIRGHKDFSGEKTMCPGRNFPMRRLKDKLTKTASAVKASSILNSPDEGSSRGSTGGDSRRDPSIRGSSGKGIPRGRSFRGTFGGHDFILEQRSGTR